MIHIIAEAGTNHNGDLNEAKKLVNLASKAGADSVKFQHINTWELYLPGNYPYGKYDIKEVLKLRQKTEFSLEDLLLLNDYCRKQRISFSLSVFDEKGLDDLVKLNPPYIKIASCDLNNTRFLKRVAQTSLKIILSTGQSTLEDIEFAMNEISKIRDLEKVVLLHCVSIYPCNIEESNIGFITTLKKHFKIEVGFSDHTQDNTASLLALGLGATWFEKHFTLDKSQEGLDHAYAQENEEFINYVHELKLSYNLINQENKIISKKEIEVGKRAQRGLYASRALPPMHIVKDEDIICVRPKGPIKANEIDKIIGKKVLKKIEKYDPIQWEYIE